MPGFARNCRHGHGSRFSAGFWACVAARSARSVRVHCFPESDPAAACSRGQPSSRPFRGHSWTDAHEFSATNAIERAVHLPFMRFRGDQHHQQSRCAVLALWDLWSRLESRTFPPRQSATVAVWPRSVAEARADLEGAFHQRDSRCLPKPPPSPRGAIGFASLTVKLLPPY